MEYKIILTEEELEKLDLITQYQLVIERAIQSFEDTEQYVGGLAYHIELIAINDTFDVYARKQFSNGFEPCVFCGRETLFHAEIEDEIKSICAECYGKIKKVGK